MADESIKFEAWTPDESGPIEAWAPPIASPLDAMPITGNIEHDDSVEAGVVLGTLETVRASMILGMDAGYVVPIVFLSREQADAFLLAYHAVVRESYREPCLDGIALAGLLGVALPSCEMRVHEPKPDARLISEVGVFPLTEWGEALCQR